MADTRPVENRLDRMIRRLTTQRALLGHAARLIADLPGPVLEFGLGKGRTYDFLRTILAGREIFAFDREVHCPLECVPDPGHLILGPFEETVAGAAARIGSPGALAHFDVGSEDRAHDARLVGWLGPAAAPLMAPGAVVVADRAMTVAGWIPLVPPADGASGTHFLYRVAA